MARGSATRDIHPGLMGVNPDQVIDRSSPVPLHHQLHEFLRTGIESGRFPPSELLPTESELQEFFTLSRTPVRQAIGKLTEDGLVSRRRSIGTMVLPRPFEEELRTLSSFTEEALRRGQTPTTTLVEFAVRLADPDDVTTLKLPVRAEIYHIVRVRRINGEPAGLTTSHIPVTLVPNLRASDFTESGLTQSVYHVLEMVHGVKLVEAVETFEAMVLSSENAKLLDLPSMHPVLLRNRVTFDASGRPVALERGLYRVRYRLDWKGREVSYVDTSLARR